MAEGWFYCKVKEAGPMKTGAVLIHLDEVNGKFNKFFVAHPEIRRDALYVAINAMKNNCNVSVYTPSSDAEPPVIEIIYLQSET